MLVVFRIHAVVGILRPVGPVVVGCVLLLLTLAHGRGFRRMYGKSTFTSSPMTGSPIAEALASIQQEKLLSRLKARSHPSGVLEARIGSGSGMSRILYDPEIFLQTTEPLPHGSCWPQKQAKL